VAALAAVQPREAVRQDVALEEGIELVHDERGQLRSGTGLGVSDEAGRVLLYQAVQSDLLATMTFVVDWRAIRWPLGLPANGLDDGPPVR
jgi:hypothetical protein